MRFGGFGVPGLFRGTRRLQPLLAKEKRLDVAPGKDGSI